jgi:uncharacterized membrane protein YczE
MTESRVTQNWMAFLARMPSLFVGLFFFSAGIVANFHSGLGMMPWGVLNVGLEKMTTFTLGEISQVVSIAVIIIGWLLGFPPGFGTFANMYAIGIFIDWIIASGLIPIREALLWQVGLVLLSVVFLGVGTLLYIRVGLGAGPRDGLMMGLVKKTGRPISTIRGAIEITVLVIGYLLGGPVGIGTIISAVTVGYAIQIAFKLGEYSKDTEQLDIYELAKLLKGEGDL